jgi:hypothetical protein
MPTLQILGFHCVCLLMLNATFILSHIYFILLRHVMAVYDHHQVYVSPARIVSLHALFILHIYIRHYFFKIICS